MVVVYQLTEPTALRTARGSRGETLRASSPNGMPCFVLGTAFRIALEMASYFTLSILGPDFPLSGCFV